MRLLLPTLLLLLAACEIAPVTTGPREGPAITAPQGVSQDRAERAALQFVQVAETIEPVAEAQCRRLAPRANCDYLIVVDDRPNQAPNAFQTLDRSGRPIVAFNLPLILSVENADELAFFMGHEASHHILGHLDRIQEDAAVGAIIFSGIAAMSGADEASVRSAERFGASVGARTYSKDYELEADQLGTIITLRSGYDPIRGAEFFMHIPDPGNRFLGSHPPNGARIEVVRRTVAGY
ncbi:M48 family metallopeptidase [Salipiger mucosus]|uniref:Peptidase, M48 family n=1 Tax=Salipiger mucosus DSM 16094 TaxID=1123237 RepID=S9RNZ3_9RHOB|nr:M48 family metallopeptidase [Salipiger mucosus]EPX79810.1 Peptidase, M48 family [Salipiger mucosus DSM 16094]